MGVCAEVEDFDWEDPGSGVKLKLLGKGFLHSRKVTSEVMFLRNALDTRVHINFLPRMKFLEKFRLDWLIMPCDVVLFGELLVIFSFSDSTTIIFGQANTIPLTESFSDF